MSRHTRYRSSKRFNEVRELFKSLPDKHRSPAVLRALGRCAGVREEVIEEHIGIAVELFKAHDKHEG